MTEELRLDLMEMAIDMADNSPVKLKPSEVISLYKNLVLVEKSRPIVLFKKIESKMKSYKEIDLLDRAIDIVKNGPNNITSERVEKVYKKLKTLIEN